MSSQKADRQEQQCKTVTEVLFSFASKLAAELDGPRGRGQGTLFGHFGQSLTFSEPRFRCAQGASSARGSREVQEGRPRAVRHQSLLLRVLGMVI